MGNDWRAARHTNARLPRTSARSRAVRPGAGDHPAPGPYASPVGTAELQGNAIVEGPCTTLSLELDAKAQLSSSSERICQNVRRLPEGARIDVRTRVGPIHVVQHIERIHT